MGSGARVQLWEVSGAWGTRAAMGGERGLGHACGYWEVGGALARARDSGEVAEFGVCGAESWVLGSGRGLWHTRLGGGGRGLVREYTPCGPLAAVGRSGHCPGSTWSQDLLSPQHRT